MSGIPPEEFSKFAADLQQAAGERSVELDANDVAMIFNSTLASGTFNPIGTRYALDALLAQQGIDPYEADEPDAPEDWADEDAEDEVSPGLQRLAAHVEHDIAELQSRVGRQLTNREVEAVSENALQQAGRHDRFDIAEAQKATGIRSWSEMSPGEVNRTMADRARDLNPEPEDGHREYDIYGSNRDFVDYAVKRLEGAEFVDADASDGGEW